MKSNFLTKVILIYDDFKGCFEKIIIFQIKTSVDNFLATFWKIWLLLIPASGHTEDFNRSRSSSLYLSSLRPVTSSSSSSNTSKVVTERSFLLQIKKSSFHLTSLSLNDESIICKVQSLGRFEIKWLE